MTTMILFMWVIVAGDRQYAHRDWRPMGEFITAASCAEAARQMGAAVTHFRCVPK